MELSLSGEKRLTKRFRYSKFGELLETTECVDGVDYVSRREYDQLGRPISVFYPRVASAQLAVGYHYTKLGFLHFLTDDSSDMSVLWQANAMNALGQVTDGTMRNGVQTVLDRNIATGALRGSRSVAHLDADAAVEQRAYGYDELGNLSYRAKTDVLGGSPYKEVYTYDSLNRVETTSITSSDGYHATESSSYDPLGNLLTNSGRGYSYQTGCRAGLRFAGPHAVCAVGDDNYAYDANGNLQSGAGRTVSYNTANKVVKIESASMSAEFIYGADGNRVIQDVTSEGGKSRTTYIGLGATGQSLYEKTSSPQGTEHTYFIYAGSAHGGAAFSVRTLDAYGAPKASRYFTFDHLGSTTTVSDELGRVAPTTSTEAGLLSYDAWGNRRLPDGHAGEPPLSSAPGHREFTGQESIVGLRLINMNGRVYDPVIGRFLSPDPTTQSATDLQTYNRYAYARNNPLRYTDPTGYSFVDVVVGIAQVGLTVASIAACSGTGGAGCAFTFAILSTALQAATMVGQNISMTQFVGGLALSIGSGLAGGAVGGAAASGIKDALVRGLAAGVISGAFSTVATGVISGQTGHLGDNLLKSLLTSAAWAAVGYSITASGVLSDADAGETEGNRDRGTGASSAEGGALESATGQEEMDAERPKNNAVVVCGAKGAPKCGKLTELTELDKLALSKADEVRSATLNSGDEYGVGFKRTRSGTFQVGQNAEGETLQTSNSPDYVKVKVETSRGERVVAIIHGHPGDLPGFSGAEYFSGWDINKTGKGQMNYLVAPSGAVLRFDRRSYSITQIRPASQAP